MSVLKRYVQAGILKWATPQEIASKGSYTANFKTGLTDMVAIVKSYFTLGLITASDISGDISATLTDGHLLVGNGSNVATDVALSGDVTIDNTGEATVISATTTDAGKVELATSAETSAYTDATRAVTPLSLAPYQIAIPTLGWTNGGANSTKLITAATHSKGLVPTVRFFTKTASAYNSTPAITYSIDIATGDVTLTIVTVDIPANGWIIIN